MRNIDTFNVFAADILSTTFSSFPSPAYLLKEQAFSRAKPALNKLYPEGIENDGMNWIVRDPENAERYLVDLTRIWNDTAIWLRGAGYIQFEDEHQTVVQLGAVTLTPKGLEVLNARLPSLDPSRSIGEVLADAASWTGSAGAQAVIQSGIETAFGLGVRILLPGLVDGSKP